MRAAQSRAMSLVEALANVLVGYAVAVLTQRAVFPLFEIETALSTDLAIGAVFTAMSIVRSYGMRRLFERVARRRERPPGEPSGLLS